MKLPIKFYKEETFPININNPGTLNKRALQLAKKRLLYSLLDEYVDELVKHKQHYPVGDISDVTFKINFKIIKE